MQCITVQAICQVDASLGALRFSLELAGGEYKQAGMSERASTRLGGSTGEGEGLKADGLERQA